MTIPFVRNLRLAGATLVAPLLVLGGVSAAAQEIQSIDPDSVIDADLMEQQAPEAAQDYDYDYDSTEPDSRYDNVDPAHNEEARPELDLPPENDPYISAQSGGSVDTTVQPADAARTTYAEDDLIGAAEGLFGQGAEGLARLIQDILADQGEPNGYIVGREGGGAFVLGVRYGSGTLYHAVEGNMPVYWTGPSIGLDAGANAGNTFVLVYNLHDTDELYERYAAGEGQLYLVGGFHASYVRKGDVVMIPIRVGAGLRLGVNAGYLRFSREQRWLPF
ncbi:DUF1134 domain-containing protein [Erythrobacter alti]|uniref:DUF1134 domain-containing protein n=1 Tax=Erythrobacter alti TaxID=1896145 RepID=UPI0030F4492D